MREVVADALL